MGANVIAVGRDEEKLERIRGTEPGRVATVLITGDVEADTKALRAHGPLDSYLDISLPDVAQSTHIELCISASRQGVGVSLTGGIRGDIEMSYTWVVQNNISLKGRGMFRREDIRLLVKMVEKGMFDLKGGW